MNWQEWVKFSSSDELYAWIDEERMFLVEVKDDFYMEIDMRRIHPRFELLVFFKERKLRNEVHVYGVLEYDRARSLDGRITPKDLLRELPSKGRDLRTLLNISQPYLLPLLIEDEDSSLYEMDLKEFSDYMMLLRHEISSCMITKKATFFVSSLLCMYFDSIEERLVYEKFRSSSDKNLLFYVLLPEELSEASVLGLLKHNNLQLNLIEDNLKDQINWYARNREKRLPFPSVFVKVPYVSVGHVLPSCELLPGGFTHIGYNELVFYVHSLNEIRHRSFLKSLDPKMTEKDPELFQEQVKMAEFLKKKKHQKGSNGGTVETFPLADIEDLVSCLPPCLEKVARQVSFPKNAARLRFTQICQKAGVDKELVKQLIYAKHDDAKTNPSSRFNIDYVYAHPPEAVQTCCNIINDTRNHMGSEYLECPFAKDPNPQDSCKKRQGRIRFLQKPHDFIKFQQKYRSLKGQSKK